MSANENFDHLVHDLSDSERINLLKKLENIAIETPGLEGPRDEKVDSGDPVRYSLGIIERIILFIRSLLSNKAYQSVQEDFFIERLSKKLDKKCPVYFSLEKGDFYPEFGDEILHIVRSAVILRDNIKEASKDRTGFIAFVAGLIHPEVQNRLKEDTDPYKLERTLDSSDSIEIRRAVENNRETIFDEFTSSEREKVYRAVKGFYSLIGFLSFPFDQLSDILQNTLGVPRIVPMGDVKKLLENFLDRINSFNILPEKIVLEAVYLYSHEEQSLDNQEQLSSEIHEFAEVYTKMITSMRKFKREVPLEQLLKVLNKDLDYKANLISSGGEEWFTLFKRFWETRNLAQINQFLKARKREEFMVLASSFLGQEEYPLLQNYKKGIWGDSIQISRDLTASFIVYFVQFNFLERMNPFLKLIQNDGEFYKEQNMAEYNDAYTGMFTLQRRIQEIDESLSSQGAYGRRIQEIRATMPAGTITDHEIQKTVAGVELELGKHIMEFNLKADLLVNLLWGILFGEVGGRYDSLSNLSYIGGSNNDRVIISLNNIYTEFKKFLELLHQIQDLEK